MHFKLGKLREYKESLNEKFSFFDNLTDAYIFLDNSFKIISANNSFYTHTEFVAKNIVGIDIKKIFPCYSIEGISSEGFQFITTHLKEKNNEYFIVKYHIDESKKDYNIKNQQNLNPYVNAENILSKLTEVCFMLNREFIILYANTRALDTWNKSQNEIFGKNLFDILDNVYLPLKELLTSESNKLKVYKEVYLEKIGRWIAINIHLEESGFIILHSDITEKIKYKESLQKKELQLKTLIENLPDLVTRWSGDARLLFANTSFNKTKTNLFLNKNIEKTSNTSQQNLNWEDKIKQVYKSGKMLNYDSILPTNKGNAYLESSIIPEKNIKGEIDSVLVISRDVTEKRINAQKILDAKNFLQSVFDASVNGIIAFECIRDSKNELTDFKCVISNNSSSKILGFSPTNHKFSDFVTNLNFKIYLKKFEELITDDSRIEEELFYSYKRTKLWLHIIAEKLNDGLLLTFSDITTRKEAEKDTIKTLKLLQDLIDGSNVVLIRYKIDKNKNNEVEDFTILNSNDNASKFLNMDTKDLKGQRLLQIIPDSSSKDFGENLKKFSKTGSPKRFETYYKNNDISIFWDVSLVKKGDSVILTALDITEKVKSERKVRELQNYQQAQLLNAVMQTQEEERRRVAESLHNDFGQLLNIALIKLGKDNKEVSSILNASIKKMRSISYELMPPLLKDFGFEAAMSDMLNIKATSSDININYVNDGKKIKTEKDLEVAVYRITQELINNAIKHSKANDIEIIINNNRKRLMISIKDNGIGFDTSSYKKRFGLKYITDRVHLLNGTFKLISEKNLGTQCFIEIPVKPINN